MLDRVLDALKVVVHDRSRPRQPERVRAEIVIRGRRYVTSDIDGRSLSLAAFQGDLVVRQKFAFTLFVEGVPLGRMIVCVGMVETIQNGTLTAVYLPDARADRDLLAAFWSERRAPTTDRPSKPTGRLRRSLADQSLARP